MSPQFRPERAPVVRLRTSSIPSYFQTIVGKRSPISDDIEEFRGIPYARVPGRWEHSQLRDRLPQDVFDATENGPRCPTEHKGNSQAYQSYLPYPDDREDEFECLNLLIMRPSKEALANHSLDAETTQLPVLVWIHGGGFTDGAATDPVWADERWADLYRLWSVEADKPIDRLNMLGRIPAKDLVNSISELHWAFFVLVIDQLTIRDSNLSCGISVHLGQDGLSDQTKSADENIQVMLSSTDQEFRDFARMANWNFPKFHSLVASSYPSQAAAEEVLEAYGILPTSSDAELFEAFSEFISDATMLHKVYRASEFFKTHRGKQALLHGKDPKHLTEAAIPEIPSNAEAAEERKSNIDLGCELQDMLIRFVVEDCRETDQRADPDEIATFRHDRSVRMESWSSSEKWVARTKKFKLLDKDFNSLTTATKKLVGGVIEVS
ncbi:hypothetical protein FocTR4_00015538 [Fusarium oxysporum f. sp. cubense]|uniref:Carboxylesterase type B domain-containing protein n=1 Tax=Fusarium oxysporum f. sp. cubense TaxID=61366 RepID=A0A5C6SX26_FUSOC|nr:hypothetical protein FocTR4_00015538 [Fusarium oxysporum f. sp. cubense]